MVQLYVVRRFWRGVHWVFVVHPPRIAEFRSGIFNSARVGANASQTSWFEHTARVPTCLYTQTDTDTSTYKDCLMRNTKKHNNKQRGR